MNINDMTVSIKINDDFMDGLKLGLSIAQQVAERREVDNTTIEQLAEIITKHTEVIPN